MMIEIDGKEVSSELFRRHFVCDLSHCKGDCCYEGDSGAPVEDDETALIADAFDNIRPYLTPRGLAEIERQGMWVKDADGDTVTPIIDGRECAYAIRTEEGVWSCAIEKAFLDGKSAFRKPISCYLYPIRISHYAHCDALNFHEWQVCKPALQLGEKLGVPAYKFLKEPIIAKWGQEFYDELETAEGELRRAGLID